MSKCIYHRLVVEGDRPQLNAFRKSVESKEQCFDFESIVPLPNSVSCLLKRLPTDRMKIREIYWGCDCTAMFPTLSDKGQRLEYSFRTVLLEPYKVCAAVLKQFPNLKITWLSCDEDDFDPDWDYLEVQPWSDLTAYVRSRISDFEHVL